MSFVGVAWAGSTESMIDFIEKHELTFPSVEDPRGDVFASFGVTGQPAWVFLDESGDGTRVSGSLDADQLDVLIAEIA